MPQPCRTWRITVVAATQHEGTKMLQWNSKISTVVLVALLVALAALLANFTWAADNFTW